MKRLTAVLLTAVVIVGLGCAPAAFVLRGESKTSATDLLGCAVRQLERQGYAVRDGNPESGVIRAAKNTSTTRMVLFSGKDSEDQIVVTAASGGADGRSALRVAGVSLFWRMDNTRIAERPSREVVQLVPRLFEACGILDAVPVDSP